MPTRLGSVAFGVRQASLAEILGVEPLGPIGEHRRIRPGDRLLDRVVDALQVDPAVVDHGVGGPGVAVSRLADAAGVQNDDPAGDEVELHVRVADADDVRLDPRQATFPGLRVVHQVLVERVARGAVDQEEPLAAEFEPLDQGESEQVSPLVAAEGAPVPPPGRGGQVTIAVVTGHLDPLGDAVVVVAPDRGVGVLHRPSDAFEGVRAVVDQVPQAEADVVRLVDRRQGRPVGVDVRDDQDSQAVLHSVAGSPLDLQGASIHRSCQSWKAKSVQRGLRWSRSPARCSETSRSTASARKIP